MLPDARAIPRKDGFAPNQVPPLGDCGWITGNPKLSVNHWSGTDNAPAILIPRGIRGLTREFIHRPCECRIRFTPPCGLSSPSFGRSVSFSEMVSFFSLWVRLRQKIALPALAVLQCDGGHGSAAGCERLLLLCSAAPLCPFGARPQGIPESSSLSWPECGTTTPVQSVQFCPLLDNSSTTSKR